MNWAPILKRWVRAILQPESNEELEQTLAAARERRPVLWLMGKTGAGKTSIVQRLTGDSRAEIGSGFAPCTRTAMLYDHPREQPVMRFLDTRGLGEPNYDPLEDLAACSSASHALLIVTRVDDTDQLSVIRALGKLRGSLHRLAILQVHTALHSVDDPADLERAVAWNTRQIHTAVGRDIPTVAIDFVDPDDGLEDPDRGLDELCEAIIALVPDLADILSDPSDGDAEYRAFLRHRREILGYASAAGATDVLPTVGLVTVPSIQGKMLHSLAMHYGLAWRKSVVRDFIAALGTSFLYRYALSFVTRQIGKLVPVYGQTAGAAAAAGVSFASTYALGRVACLYFFRQVNHQPIDTEDLQAAFREAFRDRRQGASERRP